MGTGVGMGMKMEGDAGRDRVRGEDRVETHVTTAWIQTPSRARSPKPPL